MWTNYYLLCGTHKIFKVLVLVPTLFYIGFWVLVLVAKLLTFLILLLTMFSKDEFIGF